MYCVQASSPCQSLCSQNTFFLISLCLRFGGSLKARTGGSRRFLSKFHSLLLWLAVLLLSFGAEMYAVASSIQLFIFSLYYRRLFRAVFVPALMFLLL